MDKQDFQYDQSGRLSAEDELMMAGTSMELRRALTKESVSNFWVREDDEDSIPRKGHQGSQ